MDANNDGAGENNGNDTFIVGLDTGEIGTTIDDDENEGGNDGNEVANVGVTNDVADVTSKGDGECSDSE
jgi:hypothetical protein